LLLVFCVPSLRPPAAKLSTRLSVLLPLQAAILMGLAGLPGQNLPWLARKAARFNFLESYSYAVYVLQFICYHLWFEDKVGVLFFVFLAFCAVLVVHVVQRPAERLWSRHVHRAWLAPALLSVLLFLISYALADFSGNPGQSAGLGVFYRTGEDMKDIRLPLQLPSTQLQSFFGDFVRRSDELGLGYDDGMGATLINPSVLFQDNGSKLVLTARRHQRSSERLTDTYRGQTVTVIEETWHSDILFATAEIDDASWSSFLHGGYGLQLRNLAPWTGLRTEAGGPWQHLCVREHFVPDNNTLFRLVVTGPEDAKIFQSGDGFGVAFNSYPPLGRHGCGEQGAVSQMYFAESVQPLHPTQESTGLHLQCGANAKAEKNWIPFTPTGQQHLHFVYSILPHVVVEVLPGGGCGMQYTTMYQPLMALSAGRAHLAIRASAQAVLIDDPERTPSLPRKHFLALLHMVDTETRRYAHFAYRFSTEPPFEILQVSSQLPLRTAPPRTTWATPSPSPAAWRCVGASTSSSPTPQGTATPGPW